MSRRDPAARDTKQRILDAAVVVFGQRGFRGSSVDDVAAAAGVTKGAVYYYFKDKDDLARDLQHDLWERLIHEALVVYDAERSTADNILGCFEAFVAAMRTLPGAATFLREAWFVPALDAAGRADYEDALGLVQGLLQAGIDRGDIAAFDPEALSRVLSGAMLEATLHMLRGGDEARTVAVVGHLVNSFAVQPSPTSAG